jgi:tetratricopeptide (TPR) repeat protein
MTAVRLGVVSWLLAVAVLVDTSVAHAEEFYEQQLRLGKADLAAGHTVQAIDELRVAAFGFLDRPPLLSEALVRLAIAQNTLGQTSAVTQTVNRFLDVERRFKPYGSLSLEAPARVAFESLLSQSAPLSELSAIPSLSRIFRSDAAKVSDLPVEKRAAAYEQGFRRSPKDVDWPLSAARNAATLGRDEDAISWSRRALSIDANNSSANAILVHALTRRGDCREAMSRMGNVSDADLSSHPELSADRFVCAVQQAKWSDAESLAERVPDSERKRSDVMRAMQTLTARADAQKPKAQAQSAQPAISSPASNPPAASQSRPPSGMTSSPSEPSLPMLAVSQKSRSKAAQTTAKDLLDKGKYADAEKTLQPAVASDPGNRDLRLLLLEAASIAGDWRTALAQVAPVSPFRAGEEASMFYASAALYENGQKDEARQIMRIARPHLASTPFVDYYLKLILGPAAVTPRPK